ncbi:MarR family transcriptional regulator [Pseudonocardia tropica]|uniref:MarR family transcriptional regulator n=1 Tax=Pseudonocardia tropica TaxID=681289 RepID=A0ABV1K4I2_9PSEU
MPYAADDETADDAGDDGPLTIGLLCFIVARAMEDRVLADLAAAGFDDITVAQARVMARVGAKGTRSTELAEQARVTKQTVTFLVDQLERAGYVRRVPDPVDARARLVVFAERGLAAQEVARRTEVVVEQEWTRHLGRRATGQLHRTLSRLREITDPYL